MTIKTKIKPISARRRLELSQIDPKAVQRELMGEDVGLEAFKTYFSGKLQIDIGDRVTAVSISRTIEGSSVLSVTINDWTREVLHSDRLGKYLDVQIDGLWFRMTEVEKQGDDLILTFQDREIEILRTYHSWKIAQRGQMTRAEFVLSMIREIKEFTYPVVIPELHKVQPLERFPGDIHGADVVIQKARGISPAANKRTAKERSNHRENTNTTNDATANLKVKKVDADAEQIKNANIIMATGDSMGVTRKLKIIALMTAITESVLRNNPGGDDAHGGGTDDSAGLFQQTITWGSYKDRTDPETASRLFYKKAIEVEAELPKTAYWQICANVQHPDARYERAYAEYRGEAERFVQAYGDSGGTTTTVEASNSMVGNLLGTSDPKGPFYFYRGVIEDKRGQKVRKPENTWACVQRLADDVDWRAFFVSGTFYFISEPDLFEQLPTATITEFEDGILSLDGDYDVHKRSATITITCIVGRWMIPPGSVVVVENAGPFDGRWLVNEYSRDLMSRDRIATITLKKPRPQLPEPRQSNASDTNPSWSTPTVEPIVPTSNLGERVLNNKNIHFSNTQETSDIKFGVIDDQVLAFMLWLAQRGYDYKVNALKSDHDPQTTDHNPSAHFYGKAVDIGYINDIQVGQNDISAQVIDLITLYQPELGFEQLICPYPLKCIPQGIYNAHTLNEHKTHIHMGWSIQATAK
jgi:hypothetical protein